jgi:hypothetical protein
VVVAVLPYVRLDVGALNQILYFFFFFFFFDCACYVTS